MSSHYEIYDSQNMANFKDLSLFIYCHNKYVNALIWSFTLEMKTKTVKLETDFPATKNIKLQSKTSENEPVVLQ